MEEYKGNDDIFDIYKTTNGLYIEDTLCDKYNIGNKEVIRTLKDIKCRKVSENDIKQIKEVSKNTEKRLMPHYISIFDLQLVINFIVYVDIKHDSKLYINNNLCEKYNIEPISKRTFNKITYAQVSEEMINKIEDVTKNENPILKRRNVEIELEDIIKPAKNLFIYYIDLDTNTKYIDRKTLEKIRENKIEIETTPIIIDNKNCYSITEKTLKEFENVSSMRGVEKIYHKNNTNNEVSNKEVEIIIVYKDCLTDKLYIEKEKITRNQPTNKRILLNKECYETSIVELENTHNKKFVIVDIYPYTEVKTYQVLICKCNDEVFAPEDILYEFKIESPLTKRIRINGKIFKSIPELLIDHIKNKENEYTKIIFEHKKIVPVNKN